MAIRRSVGERVFEVINTVFLILLMLSTLYPFLYVVFASISDPAELISHQGALLAPQGFSLEGYRLVFRDPMIFTSYKNTIIYVVAGTILNVFMTALGAYVLSRKGPYWKNAIMFFIVFTMFFSGGMIPRYLLVKNLGMANTRWALIIPNAIATWNLIIMRTSFQSIPDSLEESAKIDGASDFTVLTRIVIPLSIPVISVITLFYAVGHWNAWFDAMIFLRKRELYPLQLILREILIMSSTENLMTNVENLDMMPLDVIIRYATIIVATVPILLVYPFLQKYFVKGIMIGAIKG